MRKVRWWVDIDCTNCESTKEFGGEFEIEDDSTILDIEEKMMREAFEYFD